MSGTPPGPERTAELRDKMLEHLEAALGFADQAHDGMTGYLIERAIDEARSHITKLDPSAYLDKKTR